MEWKHSYISVNNSKGTKTKLLLLQEHSFINVFVGRVLSLYKYKNHKSRQILHSGSSKHLFPL